MRLGRGHRIRGVGRVRTQLRFDDGARLKATYGRLIKDDRSRVSIFDHRIGATMEPTTGDLCFRFEGGATLETQSQGISGRLTGWLQGA